MHVCNCYATVHQARSSMTFHHSVYVNTDRKLVYTTIGGGAKQFELIILDLAHVDKVCTTCSCSGITSPCADWHW